MQRTGKNSWGEDVGLGTVESKARGVKSKAKWIPRGTITDTHFGEDEFCWSSQNINKPRAVVLSWSTFHFASETWQFGLWDAFCVSSLLHLIWWSAVSWFKLSIAAGLRITRHHGLQGIRTCPLLASPASYRDTSPLIRCFKHAGCAAFLGALCLGSLAFSSVAPGFMWGPFVINWLLLLLLSHFSRVQLCATP